VLVLVVDHIRRGQMAERRCVLVETGGHHVASVRRGRNHNSTSRQRERAQWQQQQQQGKRLAAGRVWRASGGGAQRRAGWRSSEEVCRSGLW
jgi:hypothetical protein